MNIKRIKQYFEIQNIKYFCLALSVFIFLYPSFTWDHISIFTPLAFALLLGSFLLEFLSRKTKPLSSTLPLLMFLIYIGFSGFTGNSASNTRVFSTPVIVSLIFFTFSKKTIFKGYLIFVKILGYSLLLSLLFYSAKLLSIYSPSLTGQIAPDGREYLSYPFNTMLSYNKGNALYIASGYYRYHAFLNEPGLIGTISSLILYSLKFDFSRFKILYVYLLAAIFSMSLGAYIPLFIGFIHFFFGKKMLYAIVSLVVLSTFNFELLDKFIFNRLEIEDGQISGDNRTDFSFEIEFNKLIKSPEIIVGKGRGQHTVVSYDVSSWKSIIYNSGLVGFILYLSIFTSILFVLWHKKENKTFAIMFFLVFTLTIYHRPNIQLIYFLMILYGGLLYSEQDGIKADRLKRTLS